MPQTYEFGEFVERVQAMQEDFPGDMGEALETCDPIILDGIKQNFATASSAGGVAWPKRKDPRPTHPLLDKTGGFKTAATSDMGSLKVIEDNTYTRAMIPGESGTSLAGIRRHQFGDRAVLGRDGILPRPYFGISEDTVDKCVEVIADAAMANLLEHI